jgi:phosphatidylglycerol:prolipoprotein diacylglycerol transferase
VPLAVITIAFDPVLRLSDTSSVRYETILLAIVVLLALTSAAWIGARAPAGRPDDDGPGLRIDDLVFISVGTVPGAIVGGRLGYVLDHLDFYRANPAAIIDPAQGGLTLSLAVALAILTGSVIARLLGAPVGRWLHVAALPMLLVLAGGKLAGVLGATGQGAASGLDWATSYAGPGPWGSLAAELPAHPSQVYEAVAIAVVVVLLFLLTRVRRLTPVNGAVLLAALGMWAAARVAVGFSWRDLPVLGPLAMEQALSLLVAAVAAVGYVSLVRSGRAVEATPLAYAPAEAAPLEPVEVVPVAPAPVAPVAAAPLEPAATGPVQPAAQVDEAGQGIVSKSKRRRSSRRRARNEVPPP